MQTNPNANVFLFERFKRFVNTTPYFAPSVLVAAMIIIIYECRDPLARACNYVFEVLRSFFYARRGHGAWKLTIEAEEQVVLFEQSENETESSDLKSESRSLARRFVLLTLTKKQHGKWTKSFSVDPTSGLFTSFTDDDADEDVSDRDEDIGLRRRTSSASSYARPSLTRSNGLPSGARTTCSSTYVPRTTNDGRDVRPLTTSPKPRCVASGRTLSSSPIRRRSEPLDRRVASIGSSAAKKANRDAARPSDESVKLPKFVVAYVKFAKEMVDEGKLPPINGVELKFSVIDDDDGEWSSHEDGTGATRLLYVVRLEFVKYKSISARKKQPPPTVEINRKLSGTPDDTETRFGASQTRQGTRPSPSFSVTQRPVKSRSSSLGPTLARKLAKNGTLTSADPDNDPDNGSNIPAPDANHKYVQRLPLPTVRRSFDLFLPSVTSCAEPQGQEAELTSADDNSYAEPLEVWKSLGSLDSSARTSVSTSSLTSNRLLYQQMLFREDQYQKQQQQQQQQRKHLPHCPCNSEPSPRQPSPSCALHKVPSFGSTCSCRVPPQRIPAVARARGAGKRAGSGTPPRTRPVNP